MPKYSVSLENFIQTMFFFVVGEKRVNPEKILKKESIKNAGVRNWPQRGGGGSCISYDMLFCIS